MRAARFAANVIDGCHSGTKLAEIIPLPAPHP
jgi:hypothetical protein